MIRFVQHVAVAALIALSAGAAMAQRADVPIEQERSQLATPANLDKLALLREAGKLRSISEIEQALKTPTPEVVQLPEPLTEKLTPTAIATKARKSVLRVGWYYLCNKCDKWHLNLAGGYIVTADGVAVSCHHVLLPKPDMKEGYLVAQDGTGEFYPVQRILASDPQMDSVVFRLEGAQGLTPFALNDQVGPGDPAFLLSEPKTFSGYFSSGIVNRFYWQGAAGDANTLADARRLRINVSTDWAPGSSGSAVLDEYGNAIGHVSRIRTETGTPSGVTRPDGSGPTTGPTTGPATAPARGARSFQPEQQVGGTQIVLHEGITSRGVMLQIRQSTLDAKSPATAPVKP